VVIPEVGFVLPTTPEGLSGTTSGFEKVPVNPFAVQLFPFPDQSVV